MLHKMVTRLPNYLPDKVDGCNIGDCNGESKINAELILRLLLLTVAVLCVFLLFFWVYGDDILTSGVRFFHFPSRRYTLDLVGAVPFAFKA